MVKLDQTSKVQAVRQLQVSRTTLLDKQAGRVPEECQPGPFTALPKADEDNLPRHGKDKWFSLHKENTNIDCETVA